MFAKFVSIIYVAAAVAVVLLETTFWFVCRVVVVVVCNYLNPCPCFQLNALRMPIFIIRRLSINGNHKWRIGFHQLYRCTSHWNWHCVMGASIIASCSLSLDGYRQVYEWMNGKWISFLFPLKCFHFLLFITM